MDATAGQLARDERHIARRRVHDDADLALAGAHVGERVDMQQYVRHSCHLVGGHCPCTDAQQQHKWSGKRHQPQPPPRDRAHSPRGVEDEITRGELLMGDRSRGRGMSDHRRETDRRLSLSSCAGAPAIAHQQFLQRALAGVGWGLGSARPISAKLACTCSRSSSVLFASRSKSSVAIARVFSRA